MRNGKTLLPILLVCSAIVLQGCATSEEQAAAAGKAKYSMGNFESVEQASIDKVYAAGLKAMEELKLPVIQKDVDSMSGKIAGRDVADKKIIITLSATPDKMTKLSIKVGMFGDEAKSRLIYEQIKKQL